MVCGTRHPVSRAQAAAVEHLAGVTVLYPPDTLRADPAVVAIELAVRAHDHLAAHDAALVVLLGGDTADAFIGERAAHVIGLVGTGMAYAEVQVEGERVSVVTKPGGFGKDHAVLELLSGLRP